MAVQSQGEKRTKQAADPYDTPRRAVLQPCPPPPCGPRRRPYIYPCVPCRFPRPAGNPSEHPMRAWFRNIVLAVATVGQGMYVTLWYFLQTYRRKTFTERFEYPELPVPVKPRYRGFHRFDLTTCIGCDKCARACPVDCIYIEKVKNPVGKGFRVNGFKIDYAKCMFCALCVDPCPVDCIFMGSTYDQSTYSRDGCIIDYAKLPLEVAWGQATLNPTAVAASKLQTEPVWTKPPDPAPPPKAAPAAKA